MNYEGLISNIEEARRGLDACGDFFAQVRDYETETGTDFEIMRMSYYEVWVLAHDTKELTAARKMLRTVFGKWRDSVTNICNLSDSMDGDAEISITYGSPVLFFDDVLEVEIHYRCKLVDFPAKLQKPNCGFKTVVNDASISVVYACDNAQ